MMKNYHAGIRRYVFATTAAWWLVSSSPSLAATDKWKTAASGVWQTGSNWVDGTAPTNNDEVELDVFGTYTVTFNGTPFAIRNLQLLNPSNVTFTSIGVLATQVSTLRVNSGGTEELFLANGANLTLGTSGGGFFTPNKVLHLTLGDDLTVFNRSTLNVKFGSDVTARNLICKGQVNVSGAGSSLVASDSVKIETGSLNVTAGGLVQNSTLSLSGVGFANIPIATAAATVSGFGSHWLNSGSFIVGANSIGSLDITAGGRVQSEFGEVGFGAAGDVNVSGIGSQWNLTASLSIGAFDLGTLEVTGGGSVSSTDGNIGLGDGSNGTVTVTGGNWTMTGRLSVGGNDFSAGGPGTLDIQPAGTVSVAQGVVLFPLGLLRLRGGTLDTSAISFQTGGQFQWTSGTLHVGTYNGDLTNQSGILAPGHSAGSTTIVGNYTQRAGATLEIEIGGPLAVSEFDFVNVMGSVFLGGKLKVVLINGFIPTPSQTFAILIADSVVGAFDNAVNGQRMLTSDGRRSCRVSYGVRSAFDPAQIVLSDFVRAIAADGDLDGDVDLSDFARFQGCFTSPIPGPLPFPECERWDFNIDNDIDLPDFGDFHDCLSGPGFPGDPDCSP